MSAVVPTQGSNCCSVSPSRYCHSWSFLFDVFRLFSSNNYELT
ncbi:unnamed protein product [Chondrus crispus]|uniref:Uncharacterized protein n=1 Tax=Chondrus crispus TaxID=2769 RepID=R7QGF2_CHOCR|nr:unnamed protein product [Chondrus crispus]CDF36516.1 unnamed protein product [Chondrus crispus]|eukprot:XP_005716335.1 unnamed protein product [Chondrus crispus]